MTTKEEIMAVELSPAITKCFHEVADRYNITTGEARNLFYDIACDSRLSLYTMDERILQAANHLKVVCNNKFKKQENVTFGDPASQKLYNMISKVVVKLGLVKKDVVLHEYHINDPEHDIVDGVFEIPNDKVLHFGSFMTAFHKRFHHLPPLIILNPKTDGLKWTFLVKAIEEHKQEEMQNPEESNCVFEARAVFEDICKLDVTIEDLEGARMGRLMYENKATKAAQEKYGDKNRASYYVTSSAVKSVMKGLECRCGIAEISTAMTELGMKEAGTCTHRFGTNDNDPKPRCWEFVKEKVDNYKNGTGED